MVKGFVHIDETERRLIKSMRGAGLTWGKMQEITGRSESTLGSVFNPPSGKGEKVKGQPKKLPPKIMDKVLKSADKLQKKANARTEVTAKMITTDAGVEVCNRAFREAYKERGGSFAKLKEALTLEKGDVKDRKTFADKRKRRTKKGWVTKPHAIIDNKKFRMYITQAGRDHAARRSCRGAYQIKGKAPKPWLVKPKSGNVKFPAPGVVVTAAIINGKVRFWKYVEGNWNGERAAEMYTDLAKALARAYPSHAVKPGATWSVLEDNDPSGYKSRKGLTSKEHAGIVTDDLPRRSPDLNPLDYSLWALINKKMREQEAQFPEGHKETVEEFKARLRKTALGMPASVVKKCVGDMKRRCVAISAADGGLMKE